MILTNIIKSHVAPNKFIEYHLNLYVNILVVQNNGLHYDIVVYTHMLNIKIPLLSSLIHFPLQFHTPYP